MALQTTTTLWNFIGDSGNCTSAAYGQGTPRITGLTKIALPLLVSKAALEIRADESTNPALAKLKNRSCRKVAMSRNVDTEIKFYLKPVSKGQTLCVEPMARPPRRMC